MVSNGNRSAHRITLKAPVVMLVLAATAVPVELRPLGQAELGFDIHVADVLANVAGYVPVGIVLGALGLLRAVIAAAAIATVAETSQFVMMHRTPSAIDVASNVLGALLGTVVSARWRIRSPEFRINRWTALVAATLAFLLVFGAWATSGGGALNARGATSPGTLEAYWKLDESSGRVALDSSIHGLHSRFSKEPKRVAGVRDGAVRLDGAMDYIEVGHSRALRLVGSMTISAWINATSFPVDDAAIVSRYSGINDERPGYHDLGYQLDTTVDTGPRTVGFKLSDACGNLMARFGVTPLAVDTWYHVAGVYDAEGQMLNVYLNGELDNGFLLGPVTSTQRSARVAAYVGRRSDLKGYEFAGALDDVRIYSRALTKAEIAADMHGTVLGDTVVPRALERGVDGNRGAGPPGDLAGPCIESDREDARIPGAAAALGALVTVTCIGLWPSVGSLFCLSASFISGLPLLPTTTLPSPQLWMIPLVSLAGGASVALSVRRQNDLDH